MSGYRTTEVVCLYIKRQDDRLIIIFKYALAITVFMPWNCPC